MKPLLMPQHLDDPLMVLFWSADELLPGFAIFLVGVLIEQKIVCLAIAIAVTRLFRRLKEGNPDGFLLHLAYWSGLTSSRGVRTLPNALVRQYIV